MDIEKYLKVIEAEKTGQKKNISFTLKALMKIWRSER